MPRTSDGRPSPPPGSCPKEKGWNSNSSGLNGCTLVGGGEIGTDGDAGGGAAPVGPPGLKLSKENGCTPGNPRSGPPRSRLSKENGCTPPPAAPAGVAGASDTSLA